MRVFITLLLLLGFQLVSAQNLRIAQSYYDNGELEKALISFEELYIKNKSNAQAIIGLAKCYRQLERYQDAENLLTKSFKANNTRAEYLLESAVTNNIAKNKEKTQHFISAVIDFVEENPDQGTYLGRKFKEYNMLKPAITCLTMAMDSNPSLTYNFEIAKMYGELADYEGMFSSYIDHMIERPDYIMTVKRRLDEFITEDPENEANIKFKKTLLKKNQQTPDIFYNELLSWLFIQQKQYRKAFLQEKAIYKKTEDGIPQLLSLAISAKKNEVFDIAEETLNFIIENNDLEAYTIEAHQQLQQIRIKTYPKTKYPEINDSYSSLIKEFGKEEETLDLMLDYAHFLGFKQDKKQEAEKFLKPLLKLKFNKFNKAKIEILLADILVLDNKFNQALIYYLRAKKKVKNHPLAQEASFKTAKASYYKGDFEWAKTQLNVLKASTTQLIANDAMELALVIEDNTQDDSTFVALKKYAKAELYTFQEQPHKAMEIYNDLTTSFTGSAIEDDALFKQALLYIEENKLEKAIANFQKIIRFIPNSLLLDDAYFKLGKLYENQNDIKNAQQNYEQIIFNHADSIHYVEARKAYRKLRGDEDIN